MTVAVVGFGSTKRWYGSRGEQEVETFLYQNQPSAVVRVDERWAPDTYYIRIGKSIIINDGTVMADDNLGFNVKKESNHYSIGTH